MSEESVERVRQSFLRSPKKSVLRASRGDVEYDCVEGAAKETAHEALPSSLVAERQTTSTEVTFSLRCKMQ